MVHLTISSEEVASIWSISSSLSGDLVSQASGLIIIVEDSYEQADAERCSTSRTRDEA